MKQSIQKPLDYARCEFLSLVPDFPSTLSVTVGGASQVFGDANMPFDVAPIASIAVCVVVVIIIIIISLSLCRFVCKRV